MDTPGMNHSSSGWASAHPRGDPQEVRPSRAHLPKTPGRKVRAMRVWVALPKKAALYTMKPSSEQCSLEQCLTLAPRPGAPPRHKPSAYPMHVTIKTPEEQEKMRIAGRLAADVLDMIGEHVVPGVTTEELDRLCHDYIVKVQRSVPANLNYRGFPKTICTSVNQVVCHGIPNDKRLKAGDIVNIDVTVIKDGFHGDTSRMYFAGKPPIQAQRLTEACFEAMWRGIETVRPGTRLGDIGHAIQRF